MYWNIIISDYVDDLSGDLSSQRLTGEEESEEDYSQSQRSNTGSQGNDVCIVHVNSYKCNIPLCI